MKVGRTIYFNKTTGEVILDKGETLDDSRVTTFEQDYASFNILNSIPIENIGIKNLEYGEFYEDFKRAASISIDISTEDIVFAFRPEISFEEIAELDEAQIKAERQLEAQALNKRLTELVEKTGFITEDKATIKELENELLLMTDNEMGGIL